MANKKIDEARSANPNSGDTSFSDEILKLAQCLMPVAPTAKVKQVIDKAKAESETSLSEVAWKAYDSVVGLTKVTTNGLFTNETVGKALGTSIDMMLRWQRFNNAVAGAWFNALWPAVGLPTGTEVAQVRADIRGLREELRAAVIEAETNDDYARELHEAVRHSIVNGNEVADRGPSSQQVAIWTGWTDPQHTEIIANVGN
ncbi:MAG TPA: hypothetical protein VEO55_11615 [Candidatus Dormibacteraeota bacterium]|nr:hypothetical protein [Candidatus Dormibacteraeota bacterium]